MKPMRTAAVWASLATFSTITAQGVVHVVDDDGGPGVDFSDLPAAVAGAGDGDTLLVRDGSYSGFALTAKGLTIVADSAAPPVIDGGILVEQLAAGQTAVLRGLATGSPLEHGIAMNTNQGTVRVEDCNLVGQDGFNVFGTFGAGHANGYDGALVQMSSNVVFASCTLTAGEGADLYDIDYDIMGFGGRGLTVDSSSIALYDSTVTGGDGGSDGSGLALSGTRGGAGAVHNTGLVVSSGTSFTGGQGGHGGSALWGGCGFGGDGGAGYAQNGGLLGHVDTTFTGGPFGYGVAYYGCGNGDDGPDFLPSGGTAVALPGNARGLSVPAPLRAGVSADLVLAGDAGDLAVVAFSTDADFLYLPGLSGAILVGGSPFLITAGVVPAGGTLLVPVQFTALGGGLESLLLHGQAAFVETGGAVRLGPYSAAILLASGF